jgi:DNA-binding transcriptional LysR family regulator
MDLIVTLVVGLIVGVIAKSWAVAGHGIAYKSALDVIAVLREGRLIRLCADWDGEPAPLNLICTDRRQLSPAVQLLRTFLVERLAEHVLPTMTPA